MKPSLPPDKIPSSSSSASSSSSSHPSRETFRWWLHILVGILISLIFIAIYELFPSRLLERANYPQDQFEALVLANVVLALQLLQFILSPLRFRRKHSFLQCSTWVSYYMPMPLAIYAVGVMLRFQPPYWLVAIFFAAGQTDSISVYSLHDDKKGVRRFAKLAMSLVYLIWFCVSLFEGAPSYKTTWHHALKVTSIMLGFRVFYLHLKLESAGVPSSVLCSIVAERMRSVSQEFVVGVGSMESYRMAVSGCTTNLDIQNYFPRGFHMWTDNSLFSAGLFLQLVLRYHIPDRSYLNPAFKPLLDKLLFRFEIEKAHADATSTSEMLRLPYRKSVIEIFRLVEVQLSFMFDYFFSAHSSPSLTYHSLYLNYFFSKIVFIVTIHLLHIDSPTIFSLHFLTLLEIMLLLRYCASKWFMLSYTCYLAKGPKLCIVDSILHRLNRCRPPSRKIKLRQHSLIEHLYPISWIRWLIFFRAEAHPRRLRGSPVRYVDLSSNLIEHTLGALPDLVVECTPHLKKKILLDDQLAWTCEQQTHTHTILIWHIATLFIERHLDERFPETPESQYYIDIARNLSEYCYHLVAFLPELLPVDTLTTQIVLEELSTEVYAVLDREWAYVHSRWSIVFQLYLLLGLTSRNNPRTILDKGWKLYKDLREPYGFGPTPEALWKKIADCWAAILIYSTPSDNVKAHTEQLAKGGEFITHLWACLSNVGIVRVSRQSHMAKASSEYLFPRTGP